MMPGYATSSLERGYARLLGISPMCFHGSDMVLVESRRRDDPEWANWVMPIWLLKLHTTTICSVAPAHVDIAHQLINHLASWPILSPELLAIAQKVTPGADWRQREILAYRQPIPPPCQPGHHPEWLTPAAPGGAWHLSNFDGGTWVIRNRERQIVTHASIKDKGEIQEIATDTDPAYRRRGLAQAVVVAAVATILTRHKAPIFIPDTLDNQASYALARATGFEKVGEMMFWEYELPNWPGFPTATRR